MLFKWSAWGDQVHDSTCRQLSWLLLGICLAVHLSLQPPFPIRLTLVPHQPRLPGFSRSWVCMTPCSGAFLTLSTAHGGHAGWQALVMWTLKYLLEADAAQVCSRPRNVPSGTEVLLSCRKPSCFPCSTEPPAPSSCQKRLELRLKLQAQHRHTLERAARHPARLLSSQRLLAVVL